MRVVNSIVGTIYQILNHFFVLYNQIENVDNTHIKPFLSFIIPRELSRYLLNHSNIIYDMFHSNIITRYDTKFISTYRVSGSSETLPSSNYVGIKSLCGKHQKKSNNTVIIEHELAGEFLDNENSMLLLKLSNYEYINEFSIPILGLTLHISITLNFAPVIIHDIDINEKKYFEIQIPINKLTHDTIIESSNNEFRIECSKNISLYDEHDGYIRMVGEHDVNLFNLTLISDNSNNINADNEYLNLYMNFIYDDEGKIFTNKTVGILNIPRAVVIDTCNNYRRSSYSITKLFDSDINSFVLYDTTQLTIYRYIHNHNNILSERKFNPQILKSIINALKHMLLNNFRHVKFEITDVYIINNIIATIQIKTRLFAIEIVLTRYSYE